VYSSEGMRYYKRGCTSEFLTQTGECDGGVRGRGEDYMSRGSEKGRKVKDKRMIVRAVVIHRSRD
jgi:hypothetical protein